MRIDLPTAPLAHAHKLNQNRCNEDWGQTQYTRHIDRERVLGNVSRLDFVRDNKWFGFTNERILFATHLRCVWTWDDIRVYISFVFFVNLL